MRGGDLTALGGSAARSASAAGSSNANCATILRRLILMMSDR
jgi:hypothetical protein